MINRRNLTPSYSSTSRSLLILNANSGRMIVVTQSTSRRTNNLSRNPWDRHNHFYSSPSYNSSTSTSGVTPSSEYKSFATSQPKSVTVTSREQKSSNSTTVSTQQNSQQVSLDPKFNSCSNFLILADRSIIFLAEPIYLNSSHRRYSLMRIKDRKLESIWEFDHACINIPTICIYDENDNQHILIASNMTIYLVDIKQRKLLWQDIVRGQFNYSRIRNIQSLDQGKHILVSIAEDSKMQLFRRKLLFANTGQKNPNETYSFENVLNIDNPSLINFQSSGALLTSTNNYCFRCDLRGDILVYDIRERDNNQVKLLLSFSLSPNQHVSFLQALLTSDDKYLIAAEAGNLHIWNVEIKDGKIDPKPIIVRAIFTDKERIESLQLSCSKQHILVSSTKRGALIAIDNLIDPEIPLDAEAIYSSTEEYLGSYFIERPNGFFYSNYNKKLNFPFLSNSFHLITQHLHFEEAAELIFGFLGFPHYLEKIIDSPTPNTALTSETTVNPHVSTASESSALADAKSVTKLPILWNNNSTPALPPATPLARETTHSLESDSNALKHHTIINNYF